MIKTQILLWKTIEGNNNRRLRVRVRVRFLLFYSELTPTDPWCNMLRDFTRTKKYGKAMSNDHPPDINTHTVCLKRSDLKIWFQKSSSYHLEQFWKRGLVSLVNLQIFEQYVWRSTDFTKSYFLYRYFQELQISRGKL